MGNEQSNEDGGEDKSDHLRFAEHVFSAKETNRLKARFDAIANGRNHITKEDFLQQPEVGTNPLIDRVIDVVLEENGHSGRVKFNGPTVEVEFGEGEKERDIGIYWDPMEEVQVSRKKKKNMGIIVEEITPGGVAAMKGNLKAGMRLLALREGKKNDLHKDWTYVSGRPYKTGEKLVAKCKRPMCLLFQTPIGDEVEVQNKKKLQEIDLLYGGGAHAARAGHKSSEHVSDSDSDSDEVGEAKDSDDSDNEDGDNEAKMDSEKEGGALSKNNALRTKRVYKVEYGDDVKRFGLKLDAIPGQKGTRVAKLEPGSYSETCGLIKPGHYLTKIGKKDASNMNYDNTILAMKKAMKKATRPIVLQFEVRVKQRTEKDGLDGAITSALEETRPSHVFAQRGYLDHEHLTFDDFMNILSVCSSKLAHEGELMKRVVFRIYDVDNDGFIGQDDLYYMFKFVTHSKHSDPVVEAMVDNAFEKLDDSGDRKVNLAEFSEYMGDNAAHEFLEIDF